MAPSATTSASSLPVMVWLHGGRRDIGSAQDYGVGDFQTFLDQGVIVVTVAFRLNIYGYAYVPQSTSANLALWDQVDPDVHVDASTAGDGALVDLGRDCGVRRRPHARHARRRRLGRRRRQRASLLAVDAA